MCLGTNVCGHKHVWAQTFLGKNVSGHKRIWTQTCLGTIMWAQACMGTNVWSPSYILCGLLAVSVQKLTERVSINTANLRPVLEMTTAR